MPSMKVMPSVESDPDWTTSPLSTLSPWFRMIETPLRIAVAVPVSLVTWPITLPALALPSACAILDMAGQRVDDVAGEMGAIGRGQRGALLALEVVVQDEFVVVAGQDQVDAGPLEVAGEQQMGVGNDDGVRRRMRRNAIDMDMPMVVGSPGPSAGSIGIEFAGQTQMGPPPLMVNIYIIFESLSLHTTRSVRSRNHLFACAQFRRSHSAIAVLQKLPNIDKYSYLSVQSISCFYLRRHRATAHVFEV